MSDAELEVWRGGGTPSARVLLAFCRAEETSCCLQSCGWSSGSTQLL